MTPLPSPAILIGVAVVFVAAIVLRRLTAQPNRRLPPGPKGFPIVGNIGDLPPPNKPEHLHWLKFKDKYGPIASITVFGQPIILLHDHDLAMELFEKRSNIYSARADSFFATDMCGWKEWIAFQGNNALMRAYRRDIHSVVGSKMALERVMPLENIEAQRFLVRAMRQPDQWVDHLKKYTATIILQIAYGYRVAQDGPDPLVDLVEEVMFTFSDSITPGKWMVDVFHWLRHLPDWVPGTGFKKTGKLYSQIAWDGGAVPLQFTEAKMEEGRSEPCLVTDLLGKVDRAKLSQAERERIMRSAGALYAGGSDTTVATLKWLFVAILNFPEVQRKAQEEIDRVIGAQRVPNFDDREQLPYVEAVWKEALRWTTIGQLGIPHSVERDDEINGYTIPKGAMIMAATGWFLRDPKVYKDPEKFNPDRFLGENPEPDPEKQGSFGYGRRICPGKALADQSGWLFVALVLSSLDIKHKKDRNGRNIEVEIEGSPGLVYHPKPHEMEIKPRSQKHAELIENLERELSWEQGDAQELRKMGIMSHEHVRIRN